MKALSGLLRFSRPTLILGLVLALGLASCGKEEVIAPNGHATGILKSGEVNGDEQGRVVGAMTNCAAATGKESPDQSSGTLRGFDGEDPEGEGISDDGDDEGDNEKSKTKPGTN